MLDAHKVLATPNMGILVEIRDRVDLTTVGARQTELGDDRVGVERPDKILKPRA